MASEVYKYSSTGQEILHEHYKNLTYSLSLDELDITLPSISKLLKRRKAEVLLPLWNIDDCFKREEVYNSVEDEFCEFEISATRVADEDSKNSDIKPYFCHICNIEIPKTCINKHMQSDIHRTLLKLANTALERVNKHISQQMNVGLGNEGQSCIELNMFYCVSCNLLMEERLKDNHEKDKSHKISKRRALFIAKLFEIYTEKIDNYGIHKEDDMEVVIETKKPLKTDNITTKDIDIQNLLKPKDKIQYTKANTFENCSEKSIDIFKDEYLCDVCHVKVPNNSKNISEHINGKSHRSKMQEKNTSDKDINEKLSVDNMEKSNMLRENNRIIEKLNETIEIGTMSGDIIKISRMHWHGIAILCLNINYSFCKMCEEELPIDLIENHIKSKNHKEQLNAPIANKHGCRKISGSDKMHCIVCNLRFVDKRQSLEEHILTPEHNLLLEQAPIYADTKTKLFEIYTEKNDNCNIHKENNKEIVIQPKIPLKADNITTKDKDIQSLFKPKDDIQYTKAFESCSEKSINIFKENYLCDVCHVKVTGNISDHISSVEHQDLLNKALVFSDEITTNNQTDKPNVSEENIGVSANGTDIIICEICNIKLYNKNVFESHINGKKHQKNSKKVQNRDKIINSIESVSLGTTNYAENMNIEKKEREIANFSKNPPIEVVLKTGKFKVIDLNEHKVEVTAVNGDVIRINKDNWHSIIRMETSGNGHYYSQLCDDYEPIEQLENHIRWFSHRDLTESPVPDKHCLRQNDLNEIFCTICQETVLKESFRESKQLKLDKHISGVDHQNMLKQALVSSNDINTKNQTDKQNVAEESSGVSTGCTDMVNLSDERNKIKNKIYPNGNIITNKAHNVSGTKVETDGKIRVKETAKYSEVVTSKGQYKVRDIDKDNVEVTAMNGDVLRVKKDNWHSIARGETSFYCYFCCCVKPIKQIEQHIQCPEHTELTKYPVADKHCLRQNKVKSVICIICREYAFDKTKYCVSMQQKLNEHISGERHQKLLAKALIYSANDDLGTKNQFKNDIPQEDQVISVPDMTECAMCNVKFASVNCYTDHINGKRHKKNLDKVAIATEDMETVKKSTKIAKKDKKASKKALEVEKGSTKLAKTSTEKSHVKKLEEYFKNNNINKHKSDHYSSVSKTNIAKSEKNTHDESAEHKMASGVNFCLVCNVEVHRKIMNIHVQGKAHKLCAAKQGK